MPGTKKIANPQNSSAAWQELLCLLSLCSLQITVLTLEVGSEAIF